MELPEGGGHAIRSCLCMFREGRPLLPWLHFGHFGVILGAKFATILLLGRPGGQNTLTKERLTKSLKIMKTDLTGAHGSCGKQVRAPLQYNNETVKLSDNQTVQLSLHYWAPETLHFVLKARWRILGQNNRDLLR